MTDRYEAVPSPWFTSEFTQNERVRSAINDQAVMLRQMGSDAAKMRAQIQNLSGNVEQRLDSLTRSFYSFVELDSIRQLLAAFPMNEQARRFALTDLALLQEGTRPEQRPDIDGYWLPPAIAALHPGGAVDPDLAARATGRGGDAALFLTVARRLLGDTSDQSQAVAVLLDGPSWTPSQQGLWRLVLAGAFGPAALPRVMARLAKVVEEAGVDDWVAWLRTLEGSKGSGVAVLDRYAAELEAVADQGDGRDDAWQVTLEPVATGDEEGFARTSVSSADDPAMARQAVEAGLAELARAVIADGDQGERDLLDRAEALRREISREEAPSDEPAAPMDRPTLDCLRDTLVDEALSRRDRREVWRPVARVLDPWVAEQADPTLIDEPQALLSGSRVAVTREGADEAAMRAEFRRIGREAEGEVERTRNGRPALIAGGVLAALSIVVMFFAPGFVVLLFISLGIAFWGYSQMATGKRAVQDGENSVEKLRSAADSTALRLASEYESKSVARQQLVEAAERAKAAARALAA